MVNPENSILIIDDDPATLNLLTDVFLKEGFQKTMGAVTGKEIRTIIRDKKPAIILLDVNITGEDSLQILREIKMTTPLMPVIMFAEQKETELAERALRFGACSYVIKSVPISDIVRDIKGELDRYLIPEPTGRAHILVIDDDKEIADMVENFLNANGYSCLAAHNAKEALSAIRSQPPDLVFLDIIMPDVDGIELLNRIKQISKKIKVVMMSGVTDEEVCKRAIEIGASGYIAKPFSLQQLKVTTLTALLEKQPP